MSGKGVRQWTALAEALAVFALIFSYIWWLRLGHPWWALSILGFIIGTHFLHGEGPLWLGFGWKNLREAAWPVLPWVGSVALTLVALGHTLRTTRYASLRLALASILAYSAWGLLQQYLLNGYFVNRLGEFAGPGHRRAVALGAAALFSLAHLPNWFLVPVTFAGGYACARVYLRYRSLYVLALAHGVIGYVLFLIVPDAISAHFLIGPRYVLLIYGTYPELLL
jgi:hypothetical protein